MKTQQVLAAVLAAGACWWSATTAMAAPEDSFKDVPKDNWAYGAVQQLIQDGIITGYPDGSFRGENVVTRYEMSMAVAKAIDKYMQATPKDQETIDKLSAEYASELNRLGKRVAQMEQRVNQRTNSWWGGDTRMRVFTNSPHNGGKRLNGGNHHDFRHRLSWHGDINEKMSVMGRLNIQQKWGEGANTQNKNVRMDLGYVTFKDVLGLTQIRAGRTALDSIGHGLIGKAESNDGVLLLKKNGSTTYKLYTGNTEQDEAASKDNTQQLTTFAIDTQFNKNLNLGVGYYWSDRDRTAKGAGKGNLNIQGLSSSSDIVTSSTNGVDLNFCYRMGKYRLFGDYIFTNLRDVNSQYSYLDKHPQAWVVQLTNGVGPAAYYNAGSLVDRKKKGTDAWMVSYRSAEAGSVPQGGFDTMGVANASDPYSVFTHATDNVNALFVAYQKVLMKNFVMSLEYENFWLKDRGLTSLTGKHLDSTYKLQFQCWY